MHGLILSYSFFSVSGAFASFASADRAAAAALRRLKDLALLSDTGYQYCTIQFSKNGWRKEEPEALPSEIPRRFESLVFWGLAEDFISKSRAAEFLQQPLSALDPSLTGPLGIQ